MPNYRLKFLHQIHRIHQIHSRITHSSILIHTTFTRLTYGGFAKPESRRDCCRFSIVRQRPFRIQPATVEQNPKKNKYQPHVTVHLQTET